MGSPPGALSATPGWIGTHTVTHTRVPLRFRFGSAPPRVFAASSERRLLRPLIRRDTARERPLALVARRGAALADAAAARRVHRALGRRRAPQAPVLRAHRLIAPERGAARQGEEANQEESFHQVSPLAGRTPAATNIANRGRLQASRAHAAGCRQGVGVALRRSAGPTCGRMPIAKRPEATPVPRRSGPAWYSTARHVALPGLERFREGPPWQLRQVVCRAPPEGHPDTRSKQKVRLRRSHRRRRRRAP
jgi:hypothetical protein